MLKNLLLAAAALAVFSNSAEAKSTSIFAGTSFTEDSDYTYIGGVTALNSDLDKDGFLARALIGAGGYDYSRTPSPSVDGDVISGDIMVGYQKFFGDNPLTASRITLFAGIDHQNHDLSPNDPANQVNGSETGFKTQLEAEFKPTKTTQFDILGSYSTAFDTYWVKTQFGCNALGVNIGPELAFLGNEAFDQQRYGLFVNQINLVNTLDLGISAGYADSSRRGDNGLYGEVGLTYSF